MGAGNFLLGVGPRARTVTVVSELLAPAYATESSGDIDVAVPVRSS